MADQAKTLAERWKSARVARGLTQGDLGDACGLTRAAISLIEHGHTENPRLDSLFRAADVLGVSPRWLALGIKDESPELSMSSRRLVEHIDSLPRPLRDTIRDLITILAALR